MSIDMQTTTDRSPSIAGERKRRALVIGADCEQAIREAAERIMALTPEDVTPEGLLVYAEGIRSRELDARGVELREV